MKLTSVLLITVYSRLSSLTSFRILRVTVPHVYVKYRDKKFGKGWMEHLSFGFQEKKRR